MWVADIAALVTRHPEINWQQGWKAADTVGAQRMLLVGLHLGAMLLNVKLPAEVSERIARDRKVTVRRVTVQGTTLDDVFLHYTGNQLRDEVGAGARLDISHLYK